MSKKHKKPDPTTLPEMTDHQAVEQEAKRLRARHEAQRIVAQETAGAGWTPPIIGRDSLSDQLKAKRETPRYHIDGLLGWHHNVDVAAPFKTGKTTFGLNGVRSLVDEVPFLDRPARLPDGMRVGWWNGEMERDDFLDYARPLKIKHPELVEPLHLRGARMPLLNDFVAEWVAKWLRDNDIAVWWVDSWRRLCVWSGVNENKNEEVEQLTDRIDQIKRQSGCLAFVTLAHTGRVKAEEGDEHARGATALDDWVDARWVITKQSAAEGDARFLRAEGRGIDFEETALSFDPARNRIGLGEGNRRTAVADALVDRAATVIASSPGSTTQQLQEALGIRSNHNNLSRALRTAERMGLIYHSDRKPRGRYWSPGERPLGIECTCEWGS